MRLFLYIGASPYVRAVEPQAVEWDWRVQRGPVRTARQLASFRLAELTPSLSATSPGKLTETFLLCSSQSFVISLFIISAAL